MNRFDYVRPTTVDEAVRAIASGANTRFIAGGTNLVDLMKYNVERPERLVDITRLPLDRIEERDGGLSLGALVTNSTVAYDARVQARYPLLSSAILAGASGQLRNAATTGGNLLQRTRCYYFYDDATPCNKREPGSGCAAIGGVNRIHAIFGASPSCIATHPSDMCVALAALEARVRVAGPQGERTIPFSEFHRLPGDAPERDTNLKPDEIVLSVDLPDAEFGPHHTYLKLRDRLSYAFALVSVAAVMRLDGDTIEAARFALGGVAHKPWRNAEAEAFLTGKPATPETFAAAADIVVAEARPQSENAFKIELARRAIARGLAQAAAGTPQSQSDKRIA
ncbi:FAD binding domain-containing protein [Methylobacterium sp. J-068]|uniref:FAD binding domain-containing protein n=1 Tax=Methylobacterium sp. J-068 TaxID=2836649 RepID=UPI001FBA15A3|nr:xanthine dehydrogenase family protein subunit M [Methylobacterium sp. J-068]MCJ2034085.1 xanthine dehydrogenase family protein subunit M [Methylobacterium sp. J-068]